MRVADWLELKEAENVDLSQIELPADLLYDDHPDETIFYEEIHPCGILCRENHPFSTVERFGDWYYSRGQDKSAGIHSPAGKWSLITRDRALALSTARAHIQ